MAVIVFNTGFESGEPTGSLSGTATVQSVVVNSGSNALLTTANSVGGNMTRIKIYPTDVAYLKITFNYRIGVLPNTTDNILGVLKNSNTQQNTLSLSSLGVLTANDDEGGTFSGSLALNTDQWYEIVFEYDARNESGKRVATLYVDDSSVATCTNGLFSSANQILLGEDITENGVLTGTFYFDNISTEMLVSTPSNYQKYLKVGNMSRSEGAK